MAKKWIHVITGTNVPQLRGSSGYYFNGDNDPNDSGSYGPDKPTMFWEVIREDQPPYNVVTEKLEQITTFSDLGAPVWGSYDNNLLWIEAWEVIANDLASAQDTKRFMLEDDHGVKIAEGYVFSTNPGITIPINSTDVAWNGAMMAMTKEGVTNPNQTNIHLLDINEVEVIMSLTDWYDEIGLFGVKVLDIDNIYNTSIASIVAATTVAEVDAVTWDFSAA